MTQLPPVPKKRSRLIVEAMNQRNDSQQWEDFVAGMLAKLELSKEKQEAAKQRYEELGRHVAKKMGLGENDAHVVVQGSMKTQTTIAGEGREKFDLDIVVKLKGPRFEGLRESDKFFKDFGASLAGIAGAGEATPERRCWRLPYPGEPFYFDVTPAIPMSIDITGTDLRVRDPDKTWSPSNPEEFAEWFCTIAAKRFGFQIPKRTALFAEDAKTVVDPLPTGRVRLDDILRRTLQLMKLHRDRTYKGLPEDRRKAKPISVVLVTLVTKAYDQMVTQEATLYMSAVEVVIELAERMASFVTKESDGYHVDNPALKGTRRENFAEKWNTDGGLRHAEFLFWNKRLVDDLEALFTEEYSKRSEQRIRGVFGEDGVRAWKSSLPPQSPALIGLLGTAPGQPSANPASPRQSGYRDSLA